MTYHKINTETLQKIINFLQERPHKEVHALITEITSNIELIKPEEKSKDE